MAKTSPTSNHPFERILWEFLHSSSRAFRIIRDGRHHRRLPEDAEHIVLHRQSNKRSTTFESKTINHLLISTCFNTNWIFFKYHHCLSNWCISRTSCVTSPLMQASRRATGENSECKARNWCYCIPPIFGICSLCCSQPTTTPFNSLKSLTLSQTFSKPSHNFFLTYQKTSISYLI